MPNQELDAIEAARQLKVDAVLDGTVHRAGGRLRVNVNLLRVEDGASIWSDSFQVNSSDLFEVEDQVSRQVAAQLRLKLNATEAARLNKRYTTNPEAHEYYLKGRTNFEQVTTSIGDLQPSEAAIAYYKKAVELDPNYALAYAELARTYMWVANFNDPDNPVWVGLVQEALRQAESLDPQLAEIHYVRFEYYFSKYGAWDLRQAAREARQALALNPSVGHYVSLGTLLRPSGIRRGNGPGRVPCGTWRLIRPTIRSQARLIDLTLCMGSLTKPSKHTVVFLAARPGENANGEGSAR